MATWLETYKPKASSRLQLALAGIVWVGVGLALVSVGVYWVFGDDGNRALLLLAVAIFLGVTKSILVLDRFVRRLVQRLDQRGDGYCLGGFLSWRGWGMVLGMILLGRFLRSMPISRGTLGLVYAAVGTGLLISSRGIWHAWKKQYPERSGGGGRNPGARGRNH